MSETTKRGHVLHVTKHADWTEDEPYYKTSITCVAPDRRARHADVVVILGLLGVECRCDRCRAKREAGATEGLEGAEKGSGDATLGAARLVRAWATDHGEQRLYHVSPPMGWGRDYVVVSAIEQPAETLIFTGDNDEADPITDLEELPGSLRGVCDHEAALRAAGYIVSSGDAT